MVPWRELVFGGDRLMLFLWIFVFLLYVDDSLPKTKDKVILFLGDSLTEGFGVGIEKSFPSILQKQLKKLEIPGKCINAGVSASTSASAFFRFKWYLKQKPNILVLSLGANDGLRGIPVEETYKNLAKVIALAKENGMCVILTGMKCPRNYGNAYHLAFEKMFLTLSKTFQTQLMPFLLEGVAGVRKLNIQDGIHPNEKGQEIIAKNLLKYLLPLLQNLQNCTKKISNSK